MRTNPILCRRLAVAAAVACLPETARAQGPTVAEIDRELRDRFADVELMFCFQGKGSCLPYDAGVLHEAYARLPSLKRNRVVIGGNSSGSIAASYFSCFGFSDETVAYAESRLLEGNRDAVRNMENPNSKMSKALRGLRTEIAHDNLREYVAFALGVERWRDAASIEEIVRRSSARPRFPLLIVSCNKEVLEDADASDGRSAGRYKEIDPATLTVSWRKDVYDFYRRRPERFAAEHPDLMLGDDRRIGHAATFFVDRSLFELLSRIPADERIADLRLLEDAYDVAFAIMASTSEPTYFDPVVDPHPEKILAAGRLGDLGNVRKRTYYGGYVIAMPAQDVRRMLPGIRVFGTGWRHNPLMARSILSDWLLADVEEVAQQTEWWADMQSSPDAEFESHMDFRDLTARQEFDFGRRRARQCFDTDSGLPLFVSRPRFDCPAARAVMPNFAAEDMFETDASSAEPGNPNASGPRPLKTQRGLGRLITPPDGEASKAVQVVP